MKTMLSAIKEKLSMYSEIQNMYLTKAAVGSLTCVIVTAIIGREIYENFDANIILMKDYLFSAPMLLILVPFIRNWINANPITCHTLKGTLSILGLVMLLIVELLGLSKVWYLVDAAMISFIGLLMQPHKGYYVSTVVNKCKDFSRAAGYVDLFRNGLMVVVGITIVMLEIPTLALLVVSLPLEIYERVLENKCVKEVYKQ